MDMMEQLSWLCILGIIVAGGMNLRHTESTLVVRQDLHDLVPKEQADRYQTGIGVVYIVSGGLAALVNLLVKEGRALLFGLMGAVLVLLAGTLICNRRYLPQDKKK